MHVCFVTFVDIIFETISILVQHMFSLQLKKEGRISEGNNKL